MKIKKIAFNLILLVGISIAPTIVSAGGCYIDDTFGCTTYYNTPNGPSYIVCSTTGPKGALASSLGDYNQSSTPCGYSFSGTIPCDDKVEGSCVE